MSDLGGVARSPRDDAGGVLVFYDSEWRNKRAGQHSATPSRLMEKEFLYAVARGRPLRASFALHHRSL
ncbi:MAG: hypothetical protein HWN65_10460 [Candidatus Helarchaeota archaeon]|nr:hypothetical protein [Candidatus Helarchaeota archaeon]